MENEYIIEMLNITKEFPGIKANDNITLQLKKGEIHALLGENGAGKSTLMSILFGLYQPTSGIIKKNGQEVHINTPNDANDLNIGMVHQHFKLVECFSVLDNIILGVEPTKGLFLEKKNARAKVMELSEKYGLMVDPDALISDITVGMQQRTEILKMLYRDNEVLIFDEPTAVLTPQEIDELMKIMKNLTKEGKSILFITHKLNEIMEVADRCTILRKGKYIGTVNISETSKEELSRMMVGRNVSFSVNKKPSKPGDTVLKVEHMTVPSKVHGNNAVKDVSFNVRKGEIVCIAGIDGNGQSEFVQGLTGLEKVSGGKILFNGQDICKMNKKQLHDLRKDLQINARLLSDTGLFDDSDNTNVSLSEYYEVGEDLRVTWIAKDGTVLFDNDLDISQLPNHKNRPEVKKALFQGEGESVRRSDTMQMDNYYYALRLENGTVIRVATQARSVYSVFLAASPFVMLILILIVSICIVLAHFLTKQLLHPIERLAENMEDTIEEPVYKELVPFVNTIRKQHENILMAAKVRQDFTANVSHELKTPLTAISGYAELIENHMVDPEQETRFALEIQQNATRLLSLINDIIRLSELDSGEDNLLCFEQVDLDEVAGTCVKNLQMNAQKRNVTLYYEGVSCMLRADRGMISELVDNLCQNAIRYNNEGGEVHVRVYYEKGQPMLSVADNGIGIPKDQQERIFERFYRVDKSRSKQTGGTGLGLAIVKHIVELHDAVLHLESEPGKGTTITVAF